MNKGTCSTSYDHVVLQMLRFYQVVVRCLDMMDEYGKGLKLERKNELQGSQTTREHRYP